MKRPRTLRFFWIIALLILGVVLGAPGLAAENGQTSNGSHFVRLPADQVVHLETLAINPYQSLDYGTFRWLELSQADFSRLVDSDIPFQEDAHAGQVRVQGFSFDPLWDGVPVLPANLRSGGGETGLRLVQLTGPVRDEWLDQIQAAGAVVLQYYPNNTYLVWASTSQADALASLEFVRWQGVFQPAYKISPGLVTSFGLVKNVAVTFYQAGNIPGVLAQVNLLGGVYLRHYPAQPDGRFYTALYQLDASQLDDVARLNNVWSLDFSSPAPGFDDEVGAQIIAGNTPGGSPVPGYFTWLAQKGVDGGGITWADVDTGLNANHPDITGRAVAFVTYPGTTAANTDPDGHGSHTAGAIFGDPRAAQGGTGILDPNNFYWGVGAAPEAQLVVQNALMGSAWPPAGGWQILSRDSVVNGAMGSSNSWYTGATGSQGYTIHARTHDLMVRDANWDTASNAEPIVMVFSAGNAGPGATTITEPKEAKNLVVVGAASNFPRSGASINDIASYSSRGPAQDGRLLPNVMAPGRNTSSFNGSGSATCGSAVPGAGATYYNYCSGTSMAAPFVSGASALIADWWEQQGWGLPNPAMVKALLINGASDMVGGDGGGTGVNANIPNNNQGWGRVNLDRVIGTGTPSLYFDQNQVFHATGETWTLPVGIADLSKPLKISLVWSDAAGAAGANPALVNNLNLSVAYGGNTYLGNQFSNGWSVPGGNPDTLNNIENVYIQSLSGSVATVQVTAYAINGDGVPYNGDITDQDFALVCSNCLNEPDFSLGVNPTSLQVCAPDNAVYDIQVGSNLGFDDPVTLSASGHPAGTSATFTPNPVAPPAGSQLVIGNTAAALPGSYTIDILGTANTKQKEISARLDLFTALPVAPVLVAPANYAVDQPLRPTFSWQGGPQSSTYTLEIAADPRFNSMIAVVPGLTATTYTLDFDLNPSQAFFWRVRANNMCGSGANSSVRYFLTVAASGGCPVGSTTVSVFNDTFENGVNGWSHSGQLDTWALSNQRVHSGQYAFRAIDPQFISDQKLVSPPIALPAGMDTLTLQFWNYQAIESAYNICPDGAVLELSTDGGSTWTQVPGSDLLTDPYDHQVDAYHGNPLGGKMAWCGDPQDWLPSVVDLSSYAGQTARFRFHLGSNITVGRDGWFVDDVSVVACQAGSNAVVWPDTHLSALPGSSVVHEFTLTNLGATDVYTIELATGNWPAQLLSPASVSLGVGQSATIQVQVDLPAGQLGSDAFTVTARPAANPALAFSAHGVTETSLQPGVALSPELLSQTAGPGAQVTYHFQVTNTGDYTDTYSLAVNGNQWQTQLASTTPAIAPQASYQVDVTVTLPSDAPGEAVIIGTDTFTLTATSNWNPSVGAGAVAQTNLEVSPGVSLGADQSGSGVTGKTAVYHFQVTNTGNWTDNLTLSVQSGWQAQLSHLQTGPLAPGASLEVTLTVFIPSGASGGDTDTATLTVTSSLDGAVQDGAVATTNALQPRIFLPVMRN